MHVLREHLSICEYGSFFIGFEGGMWDLIVLVLILAFLFSFNIIMLLPGYKENLRHRCE